MLTIVAAWALFTLYQYFKKIVEAPFLQTVFGMMIIAVFIVQTIEYSSNKNTVLFYNDRYFKANRLLKEKFPVPVQDSIYTYPLKDFRMYSNFSRLNLTSFSALPETPCYLLYSEKKIKARLYYAEKRNNDTMVSFYTYILNHKDSLQILNYKGIVLSYVRSFSSMDNLNKQE
jgi:hypothetical protein